MVNEEIITALKNGIERGESFETAKSILINSGYNLKEVEEASKFFSGSIAPPKPFVEKKTEDFQSKIIEKNNEIQNSILFKAKSLPKPQSAEQIKQKITSNTLSVQKNEQIGSEIQNNIIPVKKEKHVKEIILLIILLLLILCLIGTIYLKKQF